jgi:acid phosphatase family membrane protein YuiD
MDFSYMLTPFLAWMAAGSLKFIVNSVRAGQLAFGLIGYGGWPSNHSAIVGSMTTLIAIREGLAHPAFGVAVALTFIVVLDASSLRRQIGRQAEVINILSKQVDMEFHPLRERMGHTGFEILAGLITGSCVAALVWLI